MDHLVQVNVLQASNQLVDEEARLCLGESFAPPQKVTDALVVADLEQNVYVVLVFEVALELHDVLVPQAAVDFYFGGELLPCFGPLQIFFGNNFESPLLLGGVLCEGPR